MLTKSIKFKNYLIKSNNSIVKKNLKKILNNKSQILNSLTLNYKYSFSKNIIKRYKKYLTIRVIGMGGSILGTEAIYSFLKDKIKKKTFFYK